MIKYFKRLLPKIEPHSYISSIQNIEQKNPPQDEINKMAQKWKNHINLPNKITLILLNQFLPFRNNYVISDYNDVYKRVFNKDNN